MVIFCHMTYNNVSKKRMNGKQYLLQDKTSLRQLLYILGSLMH